MKLLPRSVWRGLALSAGLLGASLQAQAQDQAWMFRSAAAEGGAPSDPVLFLRPQSAGNGPRFALVDARGTALQVEGVDTGAGKDWYVRLPAGEAAFELQPGTQQRILWLADASQVLCDPEGFELLLDGQGLAQMQDANGAALSPPGGGALVFLELPADMPAELRAALAAHGPAPAPAPAPTPDAEGELRLDQELARAGETLAENERLDAEAIEARLKSLLDDPALLNSVLNGVLNHDSGWAFLRDVDFELVSFDAQDGETGLGVRYGFDKSFAPADWSSTSKQSLVTTGMEYNFHASGNVAFEADLNPADFLDTSLSWNWFRNSGGVAPVGDTLVVDGVSKTREQWQAENRRALGEMARQTDPDQLATSEALRKLIDNLRPVLTTQCYVELGLDAALESNQRFTEKNYVVGAHLGLDVKAWNEDSRWAQFNLFDHPAALLRLLTGYDKSFRPRGSALPTLVLSCDHVSPEGDDPRAAAGDGSDYWRGTVELAYRSPVARFEDTQILLGASWRRYDEFGASNAIEAADLDHYDRVVLTLAADNGLFVSYSSGKLPFDEQEEDVFELGLRVNL